LKKFRYQAAVKEKEKERRKYLKDENSRSESKCDISRVTPVIMIEQNT